MNLFRNVLLITGNATNTGVMNQALAMADTAGAEFKIIEVMEPDGHLLRSQYIENIAMHLLRNCPMPVLISRPSKETISQNIMAAVDPSNSAGPFGAPANALDKKVMTLANAIARNTGQKVHILNCWRHPLEKRLKTTSKLSEAEIRNIFFDAREQQKKRLTTFLKQNISEQISYRVHLRRGKVEYLIPTIARNNQINLVVLGTVGRSGLDGVMIGNTAEKILCHTKLSLLAVKPSNYLPAAAKILSPPEAACELQQ